MTFGVLPAFVMTVDHGQVAPAAAGVFGSKRGGMTPVGMIAGHGFVVAGVYSWRS